MKNNENISLFPSACYASLDRHYCSGSIHLVTDVPEIIFHHSATVTFSLYEATPSFFTQFVFIGLANEYLKNSVELENDVLKILKNTLRQNMLKGNSSFYN